MQRRRAARIHDGLDGSGAYPVPTGLGAPNTRRQSLRRRQTRLLLLDEVVIGQEEDDAADRWRFAGSVDAVVGVCREYIIYSFFLIIIVSVCESIYKE